MPLAPSRTGVVFKKCYINNAGDFDRLARNVYKVLLTRGLRGCVIYSVDPVPPAEGCHTGHPRDACRRTAQRQAAGHLQRLCPCC